MGFRQAVVLSSVSFFLGVLFICFNVDYKLLFEALTEQSVEDGFQFYTMFYNAPLAVKALMHGMMGMGILGLVAKLHEWDESAIFFDGSSLGLYMVGIILYASVTINGLRTITGDVAPPAPASSTEGDAASSTMPTDRTEALRVLSAGNTLIILCLLGVLLLQAGQEYARRTDAKERAKAAQAALKEQKKA